MKTKVLIPLFATLAIQTSHAATVVTLNLGGVDETSARIRDTGSLVAGMTTLDGNGNLAQDTQNNLVGTISFGGNGAAVNTAFAYEMTGTASGANITLADFSVDLISISGSPTMNVDLYVNRVDASGTIIASDFENGTLIMDNFVETTDIVGNYSLDTTAQAALLSYLQVNWVENSFIFLSLKSDPVQTSFTPANSFYHFGARASSTAQIQITVPEPSSSALLGLGLGSLLLRRKRS